MNLLLDMARGIAALLVFLFHVRGGLEASMPVLADIVRFGSLGVPLFFVISGYVISASAEATLRKGESAYIPHTAPVLTLHGKGRAALSMPR